MCEKNKVEIKAFSIDYAKSYLDFLANALAVISYEKRIFSDFDKALKEQKANENAFIFWCLRNYFNSLLLRLSGFLESPGTFEDGRTIQGFIRKLSDHKNELELWYEHQTVKVTTLGTGKKEEYSITEDMMDKLNEIDFEKDIKLVKAFLNKIKTYRDKKIGHLTTTEISNENIPKIKELHDIIDELQKLMTKYFSLFRIGISHEVMLLGYGNFTLYLK